MAELLYLLGAQNKSATDACINQSSYNFMKLTTNSYGSR